MRLTLLGFFVVTSFTLFVNIALNPIIKYNLELEDNKVGSLNFLRSLNRLDYRYWLIKYINYANYNQIESLYNIRILTNNNKVQNYANFEMLKKYQFFSNKDKSLLFQN